MTHKDLEVWNLSLDLVTKIYNLTKSFPEDEKFGLISQMRRCSVSIPCNISEGAGRGSTKEFIRYLQIAKGSLAELDTELEIANRLGYLKENKEIKNQITMISKMLYKLVLSLQSKLN